MANRKTLSEMTAPEDLEAVFGCTYETRLRIATHKSSLRGLRSLLLAEVGEERWGEVCRHYTSFFTQGTRVQKRERMAVRGPLGRLFDFLYSLVTGPQPTNNFFGNGAGKLFMYEILTMHPQRNCRVAILTTMHPRNDWCGLTTPFVNGVADVVVRSLSRPIAGSGAREAVVVGEVKGMGSASEGLWQLVATMHATAGFNETWPVGRFYTIYVMFLFDFMLPPPFLCRVHRTSRHFDGGGVFAAKGDAYCAIKNSVSHCTS